MFQLRHKEHHEILAAVALAVLLIAGQVDSQSVSTPQSRPSNAQLAQGRMMFANYCSGCHGLDGSGTQRAPALTAGSRLDRLKPQEIREIVSNGIPEAGMPAFHAVGDEKLSSILAYLDQLRGKDNSTTLPGNPQQGEQLFFGNAGCSSCHAAAGKGGFIAPDLTNYAQSHTPQQAKAAITDPAARDSSSAVVKITSVDGRQYRGVVRNEDNFSIQLQSLDGSFHFFSKSAVKHIEREPAGLMPSDYGQKLTAEQIDDLVNYLVSIGNHHPAAAKRGSKEEDDN